MNKKYRVAFRYYTPLRAAVEIILAIHHKREVRHPRELYVRAENN